MTTYALEIELSGVGAGWTDITADLRSSPPISWGYGIDGGGPLDRVAPPGALTFALDNTTNNTGGKIGYYSPGNSNLRTGFVIGARCRFSINGIVQFFGWLDEISPTPGLTMSEDVLCTVVDWMSHAARSPLTGVATLVSTSSSAVKADTVITAILAAVPVSPAATSLGVGSDTYAYALDTARQEQTTALSEIANVVNSEYGLAYVKGDGTFKFENRSARVTATPSLSISDPSIFAQGLTYNRDSVKNRIRGNTYPRSISSSSGTILFTNTDKPLVAHNGGSIAFVAPYTDPSQRSARIGATAFQASSSGVDYLANTAVDGSGTNVTSSFAISTASTTAFGGDSATVVVTNNHATLDAYLTLYQIRGKSLTTYGAVTVEAKSTSSQDSYGLNELTFDMPYQQSSTLSAACASVILETWKNPGITDATVTFCASASTALMDAALNYDISTAVSIMETVTGSMVFWVNGIEKRIDPGQSMWVTWHLGRADTTAYWVLDDVSFLLGTNTRLSAF